MIIKSKSLANILSLAFFSFKIIRLSLEIFTALYKTNKPIKVPTAKSGQFIPVINVPLLILIKKINIFHKERKQNQLNEVV